MNRKQPVAWHDASVSFHIGRPNSSGDLWEEVDREEARGSSPIWTGNRGESRVRVCLQEGRPGQSPNVAASWRRVVRGDRRPAAGKRTPYCALRASRHVRQVEEENGSAAEVAAANYARLVQHRARVAGREMAERRDEARQRARGGEAARGSCL